MSVRTHYLCIGTQCWGMATTSGAAIAMAKKNWPHAGRQKHFVYDVWQVHASTYVDATGLVRVDKGQPEPLKLKEIRFNKAGNRHVRAVNMTASEIAAAVTQ